MRLLIDTNALIWAATDPRQLTSRVREMLYDTEHEWFLSAVSVWELAIKTAIGRLDLEQELPLFIAQQIEAIQFVELPITQKHALRVRDLPPHHKDPFDRMLVAQAQAEDLTLVTSDQLLARYDVTILW